MHCYRSRIINSHTATPAEVDQKIHVSVNALSSTENTACTEHLWYSSDVTLHSLVSNLLELV